MDDEPRFLRISVVAWDGIAGLCAVIGVTALIITGWLGFRELDARAEAARAQATLGLLDVWETRGFRQAHDELAATVAAEIAGMPEDARIAARTGGAYAERFYEIVATAVLEDPRARKQFNDTVYFFERAHLCVEADLCAREETAAFFDSLKEGFAKTFAAELARRRETDPDYAEALQDFAM
ncbi:hypothetical protein [Dinoroseobacter sp. S375]|uniref:hypothetical protein n=1 Tax=Dinoroseobacter sp. S375 TaxID=3415136 RepID=UPI003C7AD178